MSLINPEVFAHEKLVGQFKIDECWFASDSKGETQWYEDAGSMQRGIVLYRGKPVAGDLDGVVGVQSVPLFAGIENEGNSINADYLCDLVERKGNGNGVFVVEDSLKFYSLSDFRSLLVQG